MFNYVYNRRNLNLQSESKETLLKEARRLSNLSKRRIKQIEKRGYESYSVETLKNQQSLIRQGTTYEPNPYSISQNFSNEQLQDIIRSYDKFLTSKTSDYQKIEQRAFSDVSDWKSKKSGTKLEDIEARLGRDIKIKDISKYQFIIDNMENANKLLDLFGSEQIMEKIITSNKSTNTLNNELDSIFNNQELSYDEIERIFS